MLRMKKALNRMTQLCQMLEERPWMLSLATGKLFSLNFFDWRPR
jgi:hypothetical protein